MKLKTTMSTISEHSHEPEHDHEHLHHEPEHSPESPLQPHRGLTEILNIINTGRISESVKTKSSEIFRHLGEVEAGIHGIPLEEVHFHELGAVDTIVDIVGTVLALDSLKIERVYSSPVPSAAAPLRLLTAFCLSRPRLHCKSWRRPAHPSSMLPPRRSHPENC